MNGTPVRFNGQTEKWITRSIEFILCGLLAWVGTTVQSLKVDVAQVSKELEITKPSEVLAAVHELEKKVVEDRGWRASIERRLTQLEGR